MKKTTIILAITLLICSLASCGNRQYSNDYETYSETEEEYDEIMDEDKTESYDEEYSEDSYFGVTVDEVVDTYNRLLGELNTDQPQEVIDAFTLNTYTLNETQLNDGSNVNMYTYQLGGNDNLLGVNIVEEVNTKKVIYVDLYMHAGFFENENVIKPFREMYYCLAASVDDSITTSKFDEIWNDMSRNKDSSESFYSTVYNDKKFFCTESDEACYLGIQHTQFITQ